MPRGSTNSLLATLLSVGRHWRLRQPHQHSGFACALPLCVRSLCSPPSRSCLVPVVSVRVVTEFPASVSGRTHELQRSTLSGGGIRASPAPGEPDAGWRFSPSGAVASLTVHSAEALLLFSSAVAQHCCSLRFNHAGGMWGDAPASASLVPQRRLVSCGPASWACARLRSPYFNQWYLSHRGQAYAWSWTSQSRVPFHLDDPSPAEASLVSPSCNGGVLRAAVCDLPGRSQLDAAVCSCRCLVPFPLPALTEALTCCLHFPRRSTRVQLPLHLPKPILLLPYHREETA